MFVLYRQGSVIANAIVTYSTTSYSSVAAAAAAINSTQLQNTFIAVLINSTNGTCSVAGLNNTNCDVTATMATKSKLLD